MRFLASLTKHLRPVSQVIILALIFLGLSLFSLGNSTAKSAPRPISPAPDRSGRPVFSTSLSLSLLPDKQGLSNPVATAFINAMPGADGQEVFISVTGVSATGGPLILNIDPGTGPGGHRDAYAMTLSGTTYLATAIGFAPGLDIGVDGDDTMEITTTVGSEVMSTGKINFQRAFVETTAPEMVIVDNGDFMVELPNLNTLPDDAYLLVMATNAPPGPLPPGYRFAGSTYKVNPSGALTQSNHLMTLKLAYQEPLPEEADPHTLAVVGWDKINQAWDLLGGDLFADSAHLTLITKDFRVYALATAPTWRDSFKEFSLSGVSALSNAQWGPGDTIVLSSGAAAGSVTSIPITPTAGAANWGMLHFSATIPPNTGLIVDLLDPNDNLVLTNVSDGTDLASLSLTGYPSLKLRAMLTSTMAGETPELHEWSLSWWQAERKIYLPLVIKEGP